MNQQGLLDRIATKIGLLPADFKLMMAREIPFPDHCLTWTGAQSKAGFVMNRGYMKDVKARSRILEGISVPRYLLEILHTPCAIGRLSQICGGSLCVNPNHWLPQTIKAAEAEPWLADPGEWTVEEARELVTLYLVKNTYPLDPTHPLLSDIPPDLLESFQ